MRGTLPGSPARPGYGSERAKISELPSRLWVEGTFGFFPTFIFPNQEKEIAYRAVTHLPKVGVSLGHPLLGSYLTSSKGCHQSHSAPNHFANNFIARLNSGESVVKVPLR